MASAPIRELQSLDFGKLLGGPLKAVIDAQVYSAIASVNFIRKYGFKGPAAMLAGTQAGDILAAMTGLKAQMVDFEYEKPDESGQLRPYVIKIPFITMLPIPTMVVSSMTIDFNVRINTSQTSESSTSTTLQAGFGASVDIPMVAASASASFSNTKVNREGLSQTAEYSITIRVEAKGGELPAGMDRLLTVMESAIREQQATSGG
eukprot:CAMPEP_0177652882 /NCGR_PEP_ID=MMETSP0447-20121125/13402_1 /TAXON_ID=0 /ORGANISM="Stygamoeba regulata, Strain BSH-02190019" /LENGTH=204 /DNA_ID=CAMNT_0019156227 /DNA_START=177 /DNA_END=787 /DNA_ORIENTATION=-